jgi:hypothetical protein
MSRTNQSWRSALWIMGLLSMVISCSAIPHLQLTYRLPPEHGALAGKRAFLNVEDMRKDKQALGPGARDEFENTSGAISLSVAKGAGPGIRRGIYQPPALLKEAMESRMKHEGIEVVAEGASAAGLSLLLKSFFVDRVERKWKVAASYEARLVKEGNVLSSQIVSGEAERLELVGAEQAEVVIGELFTDVVNRLDMSRLFRESGL